MGHRALIAYEWPDRTYNCHYTTGVGCISGSSRTSAARRRSVVINRTKRANPSTQLLEAATETAIQDALDGRESPSLPFGIDPWATRLTLEEIITDQLDFLHHEAFYVVNSDFEVTAYRTH